MIEDPFITNFIRSLLATGGYSVVTAEPHHGLNILRSGAVEVDLLITNSPGMFSEVGERIPVLYLAAVPDPDEVAGFRISRTLRKPFRPRQLLETVRQLIAEAKL